MIFVLFQKLVFLGAIGVLLENVFTGLWSLYRRHWKLTTSSYLYMWPIYGVAGLFLDAIRQSLDWPFWLRAFIYVPLIYGVEALSGVLISRLTARLQQWFGGSGGGVVIWEYEKSRWSPMGLVNFGYLPFWFALALGFDWIAAAVQKVAVFVGTQV